MNQNDMNPVVKGKILFLAIFVTQFSNVNFWKLNLDITRSGNYYWKLIHFLLNWIKITQFFSL